MIFVTVRTPCKSLECTASVKKEKETTYSQNEPPPLDRLASPLAEQGHSGSSTYFLSSPVLGGVGLRESHSHGLLQF